MIDASLLRDRIRRTRCRFFAALSFLVGIPYLPVAAEGGHNSFLAPFVPEKWRAALYSRENWGELDLIPNTIFVILLTAVLFFLLSRKLDFLPTSRRQNFAEWLVETLENTFGPVLGERGRKYLPLIGTYFIFIFIANLTGLLPAFQAPTAELNTTLALALTSIIAVQIIAIKEIGLGGYLSHLIGKPLWLGPLMFPIEVITQVARVVSLSLRLFANIYAKEVVLGVLFLLATKLFFIPIQLPVLFIGLLASLIQAFIFSILTSVYIAQFIEHAHEHHAEHGHTDPVPHGAH